MHHLSRKVSIHARARRATFAERVRNARFVVSIHARARRATTHYALTSPAEKFQFTPAHDGRHPTRSTYAVLARFNSRPRTTGDILAFVVIGKRLVSIHARARRATLRTELKAVVKRVSIHARARRATSAFE